MALALLTEEEKWWREHPTPESILSGDTLTLWNYPVAGTDLAPEHKVALYKFFEIALLRRPEPIEIEVSIRGHASPTGENSANADYSLQRAQSVRDYLLSLGITKITLGAAGAHEPIDGDNSGFGLARDRRVVVIQFKPTPKQTDSSGPLLPDEPPPAAGTEVATDPIKGVGGEIQIFTLGPAPFMTSPVLIDISFTGTIKASAQNAGEGITPSLVLKDGKFSAKAEADLLHGISGKFTIDPPKGDTGFVPQIKAGVQFKDVVGQPEIGAQKPPKFIYVKFKMEGGRTFELSDDPHTKVEVKGEVKFDIGPGTEMVKRLADLEAALGKTASAEGFTAAELEAAGIGGTGGLLGATAAIGGAIGVVAVINGGVIYLVQDAKDQADIYTALLARRDGKATRVAWAILGDAYEQNYLERESQWNTGTASARMLDSFRQGRREAEAFLKENDKAAAKVADWKKKYAADGTGDFALVRNRVYEDIGGLEKDTDAGASL